MAETIYDVAIIGAGVSGACIARTLSAYNLNVVLLEKCVDVGFGVSKANSGIIHAGFHHAPEKLKSKLEIKGNLTFEKLHYELKFPFKRTGILVCAFSKEEMHTVEYLYNQGIANGVMGLEICGSQRILELEPKLNTDAIGGLYAPTGGIIEPYRFVFSLIESALLNGLNLKCNFEVSSSSWADNYYEIKSKSNELIKARYAVNSAGLFADEISNIFNAEKFEIKCRKGEEFLLDRNSQAYPRHVIFPVPSINSKGVLVIPTVEGTTMIGPTADIVYDKENVSTSAENLEKVFMLAKNMIPTISRRDIITSFAGIRPYIDGEDFYIERSKLSPNLIHVAGIASPGLTASPAIAEYVKELLKDAGLKLVEKTKFNPELGYKNYARHLSPKQADIVFKTQPSIANIVCRCESISEAEIIEAIKIGHTTLDGIKFYTRSGMGRCQGGFCTYKILKIINEQTGIAIEDITKNGENSNIVLGKLL